MVEITVNLYGDLRKLLPVRESRVGLRVPYGTAVGEVLNYLKVPPDTPVSVVVNGVHRDKAHALSEGDVLSVFPMAAFQTTSP